MKTPLTMTLCKCLFVLFALTSFSAVSSDPIDHVFTLLDEGEGVRSGFNDLDGYYIVALSMVKHKSEQKGKERARMGALKLLNDMVNGTSISGLDEVTFSADDNGSKMDFVSVVNTQFKGHLSAAKVIKTGIYKERYFSAIMIAESDLKQVQRLSSQPASSPQVSADNSQLAWVEATGMSELNKGESKARQDALNNALRNAIQQAKGVVLQGKSGAFNDAINSIVTTKTEGYIKQYEIQDEEVARGSYRIILMAQVDSQALLKDVEFYTKVLGTPLFYIAAKHSSYAWLSSQLEQLGFRITQNKAKATHVFTLTESQSYIEDHKGTKGYETQLSLSLLNKTTKEVLFTLNTEKRKSKIFVAPLSRARNLSSKVAFKQLNKTLASSLVSSLARVAEQGFIYQIAINNANKKDFKIFQQVLNSGTEGQIANWNWQRENKKLVLDYQFKGPLSEAMDQGLDALYQTFKIENSHRRLHLRKLTRDYANFEVVLK